MVILKHLSIFLLCYFVQLGIYRIEVIAGPVEDTFSAIKNKDWAQAREIAKKSNDSSLEKIVLAQQLQDKDYSGNSFGLAIKFLQKNPGWAFYNQIQANAESFINSKTDHKIIYNWFNKNHPITGNGYKYYAYAAAKMNKDPIVITEIIKDGWKYGVFDKAEQQSYRNKFSKYLSEEDTIFRIDNSLQEWGILSDNNLNLVSKGYRDSFKVQIALKRNDRNAYALFKKLPSKYYTPGLVYQFIKSQKKELPPVDKIVELLKKVKWGGHLGDKLFDVQNYIAREYIEHKQYKSAYKIISIYFAKSKTNASHAEFLSGWLALRFLNKPQIAKKHFEKFDSIVGTPVSKARAKYWLGRVELKLNHKENAENYFREASNKYPYTFYGQAAAAEIHKNLYKLPDDINLNNHRNDKIFSSDDLYKAALLVCKYGNRGMGQVYLKAAALKAKTPEKIYALAYEYDKLKDVHYRVWFAKIATSQNVFIKHMSYPTPYLVNHLPTESAFTYSIIRQESVFDQYAISYANAYGLMQLIKPTACSTAKTVKLVCDVSKLTRDMKYNLTLGSTYLNGLVQEYEGSYILAAAAYNAGPVVNKWFNKFGDPRKLKHHHEVIDWIELIPYGQTRDYVQRILENLQVYRLIMQESAIFQFSEELLHRRKL